MNKQPNFLNWNHHLTFYKYISVNINNLGKKSGCKMQNNTENLFFGGGGELTAPIFCP